MRSDHLACANCGGIVANGGCATCRITRDQLDQDDRQRFSVPSALLALIVALTALMLLYVAHHAA